MLVMELAGQLLWELAKPGSPRERFTLVKLYGAVRVIVLGMHMAFGYSYHVMYPKEVLHPRVLFAWLKRTHGVESLAWRDALTTAEAALDCLVMLSMMASQWFTHNYILERKEAEKTIASARAAGVEVGGIDLRRPGRGAPPSASKKRR